MFFQNFSLITRNIHHKLQSIQKSNFESVSSTIYALSTNIKSYGSAIAVIRVSGVETLNVIDSITNGKAHLFKANPRKAIVHDYYDPKTKELIDKGMILWFPKPKSYTGEDVCEFHMHGSPAVISKMLTVLGEFHGCRSAKEGEFTKRALMNDKLGMIQAEGIRDLINSRTDNQRRRALSGVSGILDNKFNSWRQTIIKFLAHMEAFIDFSEEELIDQNVMNDLKQNISLLKKQINHHANSIKLKSDLIKDGFHIAIVGQANVGKSSLINKLSEKDVSIISPLSGTTRDIVETWMDIAGNCVCIADTAGIKDLKDSNIDNVEQQGIKKAIQRAKECHLIIVIYDAFDVFHHKKLMLPTHLNQIICNKQENELLFIANKIDLLNNQEREELNEILKENRVKNSIYLSCLNNEGFSDFIQLLKMKIENVCLESDSEIIPFSNERHVMHFKQVVRELQLSLEHIDIDLAISSFHLRQASYYLGCLTGEITTEHVLDVIFKDFCIGK